VIITEKDRLNFITFQDRMETDIQMYSYTKEVEKIPNEYMNMTVCKRLIGEEIIHRSLENKGATSSWFDIDEKWKKQ